MITCSLRMRFESGLRDEAVPVLRALVGPVRSENGCAYTQLTFDAQSEAIMTWVSRWRTRLDLERHLRSTHFRRILAVMELAAENPDVVFDNGIEVRGLDLIHEVVGNHTEPRSTQPSDLERSSVKGRAQ